MVITQKCKICESDFTYDHKRGRYRKFCSKQCKASVKYGVIPKKHIVQCKNPSCRKDFTYHGQLKRGNIEVKYCNECRVIRKKCKNCGEEFSRQRRTQKDSFTFCSRKCSGEFKTKVNNLNSFLNKHIIKRCIKCQKIFGTKNKSTKYCSSKCCIAYRKSIDKSIRYSDYLKNRVKHTCKECGNEYYPNKLGHSIFCSRICSKKASRRKRRHKKRVKSKFFKTDTYSPKQIWQRDNRKCKSCGVKTHWSRRGSYNDNAPEIDHIVPLSKGGHDTIDNVQLLCRKCNIKKSDRLIGQASLFTQPNL